MSRWPTSRRAQALTAFFLTTICAITFACIATLPFRHAGERYRRLHPHDTYDNLAPVITAFGVFGVTMTVGGINLLMFLHNRGKRELARHNAG